MNNNESNSFPKYIKNILIDYKYNLKTKFVLRMCEKTN